MLGRSRLLKAEGAEVDVVRAPGEAADPARNEDTAVQVPGDDPGRVVLHDVDVKQTVCRISRCADETRGGSHLFVVGGIVEVGEVDVVRVPDQSAVEDYVDKVIRVGVVGNPV